MPGSAEICTGRLEGKALFPAAPLACRARPDRGEEPTQGRVR